MTTRTKSFIHTLPKGTGVWTFGGPLTIGGTYPITDEYSDLSDVNHEPDNGPFHVNYGHFSGGLINGRQPDSTVWTNYIADIFEGLRSFGHTQPAGSPDDILAATLGAKATNPSRPYVDIPSEFFQLHDIATALKHQMQKFSLAIGGASAFVGTEFGVNPLLGDLEKLLKLKGAINKRVGELMRLHDNGGLKRTVQVFKGSFSASDFDQLMQSNFGFYTSRGRYCSSEEVRVHCRWVPSSIFFPFEHDDSPLIDQAKKAVTGWTIDMATAWQLIPWTWLLDWCGSVSDYLYATRNVVGAKLSSVSVMRHQRSEWTWAPSNVNGTAQVGAAHAFRDTKDRKLSTVFPEASLPFLNESQMGILAGLSVLKNGRNNPFFSA